MDYYILKYNSLISYYDNQNVNIMNESQPVFLQIKVHKYIFPFCTSQKIVQWL